MKYQKKPVTIEAIQWTGNNYSEVSAFVEEADKVAITTVDGTIRLMSLNGYMSAQEGDYIIKTQRNEVYPCNQVSFKEIYEAV